MQLINDTYTDIVENNVQTLTQMYGSSEPFFLQLWKAATFSSKKAEHSMNIQACFILHDLELLFLTATQFYCL